MLMIQLLSATIAILAVVIAWNQWNTAHDALRLALYERRFRVFDAHREFILAVISAGTLRDEFLWSLRAKTVDACFLFDEDIVKFLKATQDAAIAIKRHEGACDQYLPNSQERSSHTQAILELGIWFDEELKKLPSKYSPYLKFSRLKWGANPLALFAEQTAQNSR